MLNANAESLREKATALSNALYLESPLVLGFAIQLLWLFILFFQASFYFDNLHAIDKPHYLLLTLAFLIAFPATCFAVGYYREKVTAQLRKKSVHFLTGLCGTIGMLCASCIVLSAGQAPFALALAGTVLASVACAPSTLLWGEAARRRDQSILAIATILSLLLAFAFILVMAYLTEVSSASITVVACLCPLFSVVFVYKAQHDNESYFKPQEFVVLPDGTKRAKEGKAWVETFHNLRISKRAFALRLGKSALPFGIVYGSFLLEGYRSLLWKAPLTQDFPFETICPLIAILLFTGLFFWPFRSDDGSYASHRLVPFFLVFLLFSCSQSFFDAGNPNYACVALLALASVAFWLYPAELTTRYRVSSMITFGFFNGFLTIGLLAVFVLNVFVPLETIPYLPVTLVRLALLLLGYVSLVTNDQMREIATLASPQAEELAHKSGEKPHRAHFSERCHLVADTFLLSQRELEILCLLAKGRNAAYVQKELVISEGTVRTHMRNIYRKLDVHSQQELMDLVDTVGRRPTGPAR
ncbi:response regulator transcription factor [Raoultibacter phocaeensis]|uniref:response regulator transcription factor n=1 Tax=Raoultibacter phocaeensis TaxID=2479841 RepID=UPI0015D61A8A|nr:helix-turn-helix transcriptional regulator [Raoultibacter phocaeensis]